MQDLGLGQGIDTRHMSPGQKLSTIKLTKRFSYLCKKKKVDGIISSLQFIEPRLSGLSFEMFSSEQVVYANIGEPRLLNISDY